MKQMCAHENKRKLLKPTLRIVSRRVDLLKLYSKRTHIHIQFTDAISPTPTSYDTHQRISFSGGSPFLVVSLSNFLFILIHSNIFQPNKIKNEIDQFYATKKIKRSYLRNNLKFKQENKIHVKQFSFSTLYIYLNV